jgi:indolepyruvate ferredoxin oxidoreductase beta subunit
VGGQGILLSSEVTSYALLESGFDVKKSEVHGMAQRGGSVVAHLRFGEKIYSPLIEPGSCDIEVSFELLESLRYLPFLNKQSNVIVNTQRILPPSIAGGKEDYPAGILKELTKRGISVYPVDALRTARELGETRAVNMVMVGVLSRFIPVKESTFVDVISDTVREQFVKVNLEAFRRGREAVHNPQVSGDERTLIHKD